MGAARRILAIVGPTASGKSSLAMLIASRIGGEIVSADSRQVYKHLDIGTAKPSADDRSRVPHHFIDILEPDQEYSAGAYGTEARRTIETLLQQGRPVLLVGGSGLYIRAVLDGLFAGPCKDAAIRSRLEEELKKFGGEILFERIRKIDPAAAATMDPTKTRRIIRALEVYEITGRPISELHAAHSDPAPFEVTQVALSLDRATLYERIDSRVDEMVRKGLVEEVQRLRSMGYSSDLNALNTVGYKEAFLFLDGEMDRETMVDAIRRNTRRFAKRQGTWFRADARIRWIPAGSEADVVAASAALTDEMRGWGEK